MVQLLLNRARGAIRVGALCAIVAALLHTPAWAASKHAKETVQLEGPELQMEGGRKLTYEGSFSLEKEARPKPGFFKKLVDVVVGGPTQHFLVTPYSVTTDSHGRVIVSDPGANGVHVFDFAQKKYKFLTRKEKDKDGSLRPQCVATDANDNIYVSDSEAGKIFVFNAEGKYVRAIGSLKGGEGFFKRPTGVAVDSAAQKIYITDTLRDKIYVMDMQGSVLASFGKNGTANGEFNYPTELRIQGDSLAVVDAMNFRVQVFDKAGNFRYAIGKIGDGTGAMFRPKGIAFDSEGHLYIADGAWNVVQVFNSEGQLLYYFGQRGTGPGEFQLPAGLQIDANDRVFVADSYNHRIQVFHYFGLPKQAEGKRP